MKYFAYSQKEFLYKYVVMLSDIDQFRHMSFANYLKLMFLATDALFMSHLNQEMNDQRYPSLKCSRMQFKKQSVAGDSILIKVNACHISDRDFVLVYTFVSEHTGDLIALGRQTYELLPGERSPAAMPDFMRKQLQLVEINEEHSLYKY